MRIVNSMYYNSIYGTNNSKINKELFDVNKQIASGLKIEYAKDDVRIFSETMRLDNEITTLKQIKKSTETGSKMTTQTDTVLSQFNDNMKRMRTLLVQAANGTNDDISLDAIANELKGIEKNLKGLANTSINGQYLFSGSAVNVAPIDSDGIYHGNDLSLNVLLGSNNKQAYNISGSELFLGEEVNRKRRVTSNVKHSNLVDSGKTLDKSSQLRELMGDKDNDDSTINKDYFYLRGTKSDGTAIKKKIVFDDNKKISDLLESIGTAYGNSGNINIVDVTMNSQGEIEVKDKLKGSSKLDFHLVGAVDYSGGDKANVDDIDQLNDGETSYPPKNDLFVNEFSKSGLQPVRGAADKIEGLIYDRTQFTQSGSLLQSNAPQIVKEGNAFASPSTKISEVADLSQTNADTLDGSSLKLTGKDIKGNEYDVDIDFKSTANGGSYFIYNGSKYHIYDMDPNGRKAVDADKMTYQQLLDVVNMVVTKNLPASDSADEYDKAIKKSATEGTTSLTYDGKINFKDLTAPETQASISLYDPNSDDFSSTAQASIMTFNTNNALTVSDPKTDFFKALDEIVNSVEDHKLYPDANSGRVRNVGIENSLSKMDDLLDHVNRIHSKVGAQSNTLSVSLQRTEILETSTISLRSSVIDTDLAESSLRLTQLTTNYQAMLSTVGKVSKLSLVNYL